MREILAFILTCTFVPVLAVSAFAKDELGFDDLVANLKSPVAKTRQESATALGKSRRREAVAPLSDLVRDPEPKVRLEVVRALRELRDLSGVPSLTTSLEDGWDKVRDEAISALVEIYAERDRNNGPVQKFLEIFSDEYDRSSLPPYVNVDPRVFDGLGRTLKDEKPEIREDAALALGILNGKPALPGLISALGDETPAVRAAAATAIGKIGTAAYGRNLTPDHLVAPALRGHVRAEVAVPVAHRLSQLTDREQDVVALVAAGLTNAQIARRLHVSVSTVKTHMAGVRTKLDLRSRTQIAVWYTAVRQVS